MASMCVQQVVPAGIVLGVAFIFALSRTLEQFVLSFARLLTPVDPSLTPQNQPVDRPPLLEHIIEGEVARARRFMDLEPGRCAFRHRSHGTPQDMPSDCACRKLTRAGKRQGKDGTKGGG